MLEVIMAESDVDAFLALRAYERMHTEGTVPGRLDPVKTFAHLLRWVKGPGSVVLLAMDGDNIVGALTLVESTSWFANDADTFLSDRGFYVMPEYRDGEAAKLLLDAAKTIGDDTKLPVFITINNGKRKRGGRSEWERVGATLGYLNRGATMAHYPEN